VPKLTEKQMLLLTGAVPVLLVGGIGYLCWTDLQKIHAAEITESNPDAADVTDPEQWGENRRCQEYEKQMVTLRGEAELIGEREKQVIVYREIVQRDSQVLPDQDLVNQLADTINDFERQSGVTVTSVTDLTVKGDAKQAIRKLPIRLSLQGSFDQFLRFLNLFESMDRIVNTRGFAVQRATAREASDGPPRHGITLELETYVYSPGAGLAKPVEIANYEKRKDDPAVQKAVKQQKAAKVEKYQLKPRINRRDPLVDPRRLQSGADEAVSQEKYEEQRNLLERLRHEVETLKEDVRLEQQYLQEKKYLQYVQLKALNDEKIGGLEGSVKDADPRITVAELRDQFTEDVVAQFTQLAGDRRAKGGTRDQFVLRQHVAEFLERMRTEHGNREYEKSMKTLGELETLLGSGGRRLAEDAAPLVAEMRELGRECQVMLEFERLDLKVSGLILRPQGSSVILGGRIRKAGDTVDEKGRCRLAAIREDALVFELDGYEIVHELEKK
jgi:Tfp pilus assembly protein PilO